MFMYACMTTDMSYIHKRRPIYIALRSRKSKTFKIQCRCSIYLFSVFVGDLLGVKTEKPMKVLFLKCSHYISDFMKTLCLLKFKNSLCFYSLYCKNYVVKLAYDIFPAILRTFLSL